jgi:outer membrane protein TolC
MRKVLGMILAGQACLFVLVPGVRATESAGVQTASPGEAKVLRLDDAVSTALAQNPAVQAARYAAEAERLKVPQARSLPEPSLGIGWMGNITPFSVQQGDPSSYRGVSAMQTIPYPGKLRLRGEIASQDAGAAQTGVETIQRQIATEVRAAFYDYWYYDRALETTQKNKDLLDELAQIAESRYRVGKGIQQDILKSQVEVSMLLQKLTVLEQQRATAQAQLNALLGNPPDTALPPAAPVEPAALTYTLDDLYKLAGRNDPELHRMQQMTRRNQLAVELARKDYRPDLSVGYMYEQRPAMPDMHGFTFTVDLPVFYKSRQREAVEQATDERIGTEHSRDARHNQLYFELKEQYLAAQASDQLLKLFVQAVIPQSSLALESSMSAYQTGSADFATVLGNFTTIVNYETDYYREVANYQTALARMEALTGVELTSGAAQPVAPQTK